MTTVHISLGRDDGTDQTAAKGVVEWEPTTRREDGTMVILERGFVAPLVDGEATVVVDPSGLTWCWRVTERTDSGGTVRYVSVPDSATTVEYVDLPDVDPTTLVAWSPADPEAAYQTALDNLDVETAVSNYLLANPVSAPVDSVNGQTGAVALGAADVGADPAGTAAGLVGALAIPDSADDVGAIPEPAVEGASGDVLVTDGAGGRTWATPDAGVTGPAGAVAGNLAALDATGKVLSDSGAKPSDFAPALGVDDNYVTDAEKAALHSHANKTALDQVSGVNTGDQDLSGLVAKATIDAKGDLLVGTADNTVGRLAVGATNGHVLTLDSAEAAGMKWAAAAGGGVPLTRFYAPWSWASTATTGGHVEFTLIAGRLVPSPQFVNVSKTATKVNLRVDTGVAGTSIEVALYTINADGTSTHLSTLGTIDSTTSGEKTITGLSVSMPAGLYAVVLRPIGGNVTVWGRTGGFLLAATSDATGGTNNFLFPHADGTSMPASITWKFNAGVYGNNFPIATMGW